MHHSLARSGSLSSPPPPSAPLPPSLCAPQSHHFISHSFPHLATIASLALGRFIIMPQQRAWSKRAGLPQQNGKTHAAAGDKLANEAAFALSTNDPSGFTLVDTFAYGAIGHALGYFALATASLSAAGFDAKPF